MKSFWRSIRVVAIAAFAMIACVNMAVAQTKGNQNNEPERKRPEINIELGAGVGASYTGIYSMSTTNIGVTPRYGLGGHVDLALCIGRNLAIETEVNYEGGSVRVENARSAHNIKTRTMDIPLLLSLRVLGGRIRVNAGPLFTVRSSAEYSTDDQVVLYGPMYPTWNLAAGVGVGIRRHFLIEARCIYGLTDTVNQYEGEEFTARTYRISAGLTWLF